ncbi:RAB7A-interacting MON1-CCZ1 complex subunit 1-like [Oppia nitens]|uniref:RAB7A-interacting MON1-CCZ1 complex subunit 1-like n=1 Tax=Oppia nitens TaxID=1686743 RepID=UPI0023DA8510|nr:RAB7A-interacting MON1-CCZ1 complex subunit 1-like [Oppia nitens]
MDDLVRELNVLRLDCNHSRIGDGGDGQSQENERQLVDTIERYARTVLSITWDQEMVITNDEFKTKNSEAVMNSIIYLLDGIGQLCDELDTNGHCDQQLSSDRPFQDNTKCVGLGVTDYTAVKTLLGIDICECLLWRKAALLYAFCNSKLNAGIKFVDNTVVVEDNSDLRDEETRHKLLQYLIDGIQWFRQFLSQRQPFEVNSGAEMVPMTSSESLLTNNIFSDNHLLSLMYLSEMCVWYHNYSNHWRLYLYTGFDVEEWAKYCLRLYINSVDNHFNTIGWNCDKAKQLLTLF